MPSAVVFHQPASALFHYRRWLCRQPSACETRCEEQSMNEEQSNMGSRRIENVSRRRFLQHATGLTLAVYFGPSLADEHPAAHAAQASAPTPAFFAPNAFLRIDTTGTVTVISKHLEMGQGIYTGLATIVSEDSMPPGIGYESKVRPLTLSATAMRSDIRCRLPAAARRLRTRGRSSVMPARRRARCWWGRRLNAGTSRRRKSP